MVRRCLVVSTSLESGNANTHSPGAFNTVRVHALIPELRPELRCVLNDALLQGEGAGGDR